MLEKDSLFVFIILSMDKIDILQQLQDIIIFKQKVLQIIGKGSGDAKIMAIDFGTKKIGVAVSDKDGLLAFPKDVLIGNWLNVDAVMNAITQQIKIHQPIAIVFGLPKTLNGSLHENCKIIIPVASNINQMLPVLLLDERFTTKFANRNIYNKQKLFRHGKANDYYKNNHNNYDDNISATIILNDALTLLKR